MKPSLFSLKNIKTHTVLVNHNIVFDSICVYPSEELCLIRSSGLGPFFEKKMLLLTKTQSAGYHHSQKIEPESCGLASKGKNNID